jgi:tetratricopeptide (TPR) repeat protein
MERVIMPDTMASEKGNNLKTNSINLPQSARSERAWPRLPLQAVNRGMSLSGVKTENKPSAHWWEKVLVAVLFILALIYASSAKAASEADACPPKALQAFARVCMSKGEYEKAEMLIDRALSTATSDEDKSSCLIDKAWVYKNQGRFAQAGQSCLLGLQLQQRVYYADHPYIAYTLRILGSIYQAQGDFRSAAESFDRAISIIRKCHTADDPVVASFEIDAARLLTAEGKFAQAEQQYERAITVIIDYYGPDNLYTASVLGDFAQLYYIQGRLDEAQSMLDYSLDIQEKVYGQDNRLLVGKRLTLARILQARGQTENARNLLTKALDSLKTVPAGSSLMQQGELLTALAELEFDSGNFNEARYVCEKAIGMLEKSAGRNSELTAMAINCRARLCIMQGSLDKAYEFGCEALRAIESSLDSSHPSITAVNKTILLSQELETVTLLAKAEGWINLPTSQ